MLLVELDQLQVLVTNENAPDMPPAAEGGNNGTRDVGKRRKVTTPYQKADGGDQQLHRNGGPCKEEHIHGSKVAQCRQPNNSKFRRKGSGTVILW